MTRGTGDYENAKIYQISSISHPELVYIGTTCSSLSKRHCEHKRNYKTYSKGLRSYVSSFEIMKLGDTYIELVEAFPCASKQQMLKREGDLIRATNCVNIVISGRTQKQYYADNKPRIREQHRLYKIANYESINKNRLKKKQCACGASISRSNMARHQATAKHNSRAIPDCGLSMK